ncbi:hypothetical protein [Streptomyces clavuligerus]|uniref:hypothetical protein n=1 Tax=Streptomyces clavuligerus TaxID=1901 RepID=UPI000185157E|nr:hypothetical protein [Streptomyces clavuligerus]MBY6307296.1 hypothetical protein [Streptomyces clavuligerus]QPJ97820.1 hypothetical protein GE265_32775 [Streptomyces clavuligerus]QPL67434.1 hypothetical protein I3J04_30800 [Streptomyces clavuligerus]QPL73464.1 hypothetical protein I3J05_29700 [Streptomyces clavuligerus]QPL73483.1 hypothetical protein I3J05_31135 [Streptomyces clavuligerus]
MAVAEREALSLYDVEPVLTDALSALLGEAAESPLAVPEGAEVLDLRQEVSPPGC